MIGIHSDYTSPLNAASVISSVMLFWQPPRYAVNFVTTRVTVLRCVVASQEVDAWHVDTSQLVVSLSRSVLTFSSQVKVGASSRSRDS